MKLTESQLKEGTLKRVRAVISAKPAGLKKGINSELAKEQLSQATVPAKKAAQYLGFSYWKLLEMVKDKEIPHIKAGNRLLFRLASLDAWLAQQEAASTAEPVPEGKIRRLK